jgi:hypothetical protein
MKAALLSGATTANPCEPHSDANRRLRSDCARRQRRRSVFQVFRRIIVFEKAAVRPKFL